MGRMGDCEEDIGPVASASRRVKEYELCDWVSRSIADGGSPSLNGSSWAPDLNESASVRNASFSSSV